jgi:dihydrofolate reductase
MIVVTRQEGYHALGCLVVHSIADALELTRSRGETEAFIIGGAQIYAQTIDLADRIYLTQVQTSAGCDVFFPEFDCSGWIELERGDHPADPQNDYPHTFHKLVRSARG